MEKFIQFAQEVNSDIPAKHQVLIDFVAEMS